MEGKNDISSSIFPWIWQRHEQMPKRKPHAAPHLHKMVPYSIGLLSGMRKKIAGPC